MVVGLEPGNEPLSHWRDSSPFRGAKGVTVWGALSGSHPGRPLRPLSACHTGMNFPFSCYIGNFEGIRYHYRSFLYRFFFMKDGKDSIGVTDRQRIFVIIFEERKTVSVSKKRDCDRDEVTVPRGRRLPTLPQSLTRQLPPGGSLW